MTEDSPWKPCQKRQEILDASGHCLVLGGPGSGKTTLALKKALRHVSSGLLPGRSVLFLSFSRAAVARVTDAAKAELAGVDSKAFAIQTFHSFFWQILQSHGYLMGCPRDVSIIPSHEEAAMRGGIKEGEQGWDEWTERRAHLFRSEGKVCFDLFAPLTADLLRQCHRIRARYSQRYPLIIVDEAQDTSDAQWEVVQLLSQGSQVVCLADPDQMIYGHLKGVRPERVRLIRKALAPCEVDLGSENNRSPGTDIARLARDIYSRNVGARPYAGVTVAPFKFDKDSRDKAIRSSTARLRSIIQKETGAQPESIAILTSYGSGVATVSAALQQEKPITHQVLFDESFVLLCARALAYLLEPKEGVSEAKQVADLLDLCATAYSAKGKETHRKTAAKLRSYAIQLRAGKSPAYKCVGAARSLLAKLAGDPWSGVPRKDWVAAKNALRSSGDSLLQNMASGLDYVVAFARGQRINDALSDIWMSNGSYVGARGALDLALAQDQLIAGDETLSGLHVMNIHKAKGKQFDGVILLRLQYESPFVWRDEDAPHEQGRRLLHMALTRARKHVLIVNQIFPACPILKMHKLV
ncbi:UvrD-helicase domain-containing protein [Stenotrophomonas geniculata]